MRKKLAAYATAAVLIGIAVMILPLALKTKPPPQPDFTGMYPEEKNASEQRDQLDNAYRLPSQPSNVTSSSLILLVGAGLAIAFAAYMFFKRQMG